MHLTTQEVPVQNLEVGMYISRLDVPWVQTPFPIQGFYITKQEELALLSHYCNVVYVDQFLSKVDVSSKLFLKGAATKQANQIDPRIARLINEKARFKPRIESYNISRRLKREVKSASHMYQKVTAQMSAMYKSMMQNGYINIQDAQEISSQMVSSIVKNPNALAWLCRISDDDKTLHQQAIRSAVWGLVFARYLGLSRKDLTDIGTALLLAPIGKCKLPKELLYSRQSNEETNEYQTHVELTLEETQQMFSTSHQINYILSAYCERNNGTGYPRQLVGNRIPFLARVAGIADYYEQLINPYPGAEALTPVEAISHLYNTRGELFQRELVEEFIQAIGIYPTGSMVKLTNNAIGVVVEQPEKSRLRPRVALVTDSMNIRLEKPKIVNLAKDPTDSNGVPMQICKSLKSTSTDIKAEEIHEKLFGNTNWLTSLVQI
ncbi:HD-GYP domain-containing protein [Aliikangiella sp. IMCC44359]|uniref:HD-GYP domain-containing protein n=1 Tax=Aliikangiella sp. IMCC44359 TaxID=3459125 RepID=UPI00403AF661